MENVKKYCENRIKELEEMKNEHVILAKIDVFKEIIIVLNLALEKE